MSGQRYRTIVGDPPWPIKDSGPRTRSTAGFWDRPNATGMVSRVPYPTMSLEEIAALPIDTYAEPDAHLYVWTINAYIEQTYEIVRSWGFKPSTLLTWCKAPMGIGLGGAYTITTEYVLYARRGTLKPTRRWDSTWFQFKRPYNHNGAPAHSAKPEGFLDVVEQVSPGPYAELFARRARFGWDYPIGDQALGGSPVPVAGSDDERERGHLSMWMEPTSFATRARSLAERMELS